MMIALHYYDTDGAPHGPTVFLAGPTTDGAGGVWVKTWQGHKLSAWRAEAAELFAAAGFTGTLIVPEFSQPGDFKTLAAKAWPVKPSGPRSAPLLWEDKMMASATVVIFWADLSIDGPNRGLSARPECSELIFRSRLQGSWTWGVRHLVLGIPVSAQKVGRYEGLGTDAGLPIWRTLTEVVRAANLTFDSP